MNLQREFIIFRFKVFAPSDVYLRLNLTFLPSGFLPNGITELRVFHNGENKFKSGVYLDQSVPPEIQTECYKQTTEAYQRFGARLLIRQTRNDVVVELLLPSWWLRQNNLDSYLEKHRAIADPVYIPLATISREEFASYSIGPESRLAKVAMTNRTVTREKFDWTEYRVWDEYSTSINHKYLYVTHKEI